jgi:pimeloyl-ACP methyl ester carboxylesterase
VPKVNLNGIDVYYEVHGEGGPILGIHGTPSSAVLWVVAARMLAGIGRCIIYDRRGFFRSARPEPFETVDLSDQVDDAAAVLDALSPTPAVCIPNAAPAKFASRIAPDTSSTRSGVKIRAGAPMASVWGGTKNCDGTSVRACTRAPTAITAPPATVAACGAVVTAWRTPAWRA